MGKEIKLKQEETLYTKPKTPYCGVETNRWYNIKILTNLEGKFCSSDFFEAKFNGTFWIDINGNDYPMWDVIEINQELAF